VIVSPIGVVFQSFKLLLPALVPSWRFFDVIAPSPRIEFILLDGTDGGNETGALWQEFRPRPLKLTITAMLKRMFWNPQWNEDLFLVSCSERLTAHPTAHSRQEIVARIIADLGQHNTWQVTSPNLQFRLVFLTREEDQIIKEVTFTSAIYDASGIEIS
jgi:hypothetical protein